MADLFDSLAAAAAEDDTVPGTASAYRPHLGAGALDEALSSGAAMRVRCKASELFGLFRA